MNDEERKNLRQDFREAVNMSPSELESWLDTEESKSVGDSENGESTGHLSGRRILEIKDRTVDELTNADHEHMHNVVGYVNRHLAPRPAGDVSETSWRYSLMNWGHDPLKGG